MTTTGKPPARTWIPIDVLIRAAELREERWLDQHKVRTDSPANARQAGGRRRGTGRGGQRL